ncbi:hypothetical protein HY256_09925, partial [Candidatus Sumerlaeota bacterium]|nr:hypothetical protein [Candidatus Sumerlaeota bacterium]
MEKTNRNWLLAYVLGFISGIAGLVSCSHLAHTLRTRPDGNERTLPAASRKLPETPPVRLEVIREASLPSSALNIAPAPPALYVSLAFEGLAVFSMDDPTSPKTIEIQPGMVDPKDPGARVVLRVLPDPAHKRLLALDRVQGLTIYDATDPLHPRPRWSKGMPEGVNARPIGIVEIGKYYYLSCGGGGLRVLPKNFDPETGSTMALNIFDHTRESVFYPPHYLLVADGYDTGLQVL